MFAYSRRFARAACVSVAAGLVAVTLPMGSASAASNSWETDPEYLALSAASIKTQGASYYNGDIVQTATLNDGTQEMTFDVEVGYRANGQAGVKMTFTGRGQVAPMSDLNPTRFISKSLQKMTSTAIRKRAGEPIPPATEITFWEGQTPDYQDFDYLPTYQRGVIEQKALRAIGSPNADFLVSWTQDNYGQALQVARDINPGSGLASLVGAALDEYISVGDIRAESGADGVTKYFVPIQELPKSGGNLAYDFVFSVNADGLVSAYEVTAEQEGMSTTNKTELLMRSSALPPIAGLPADAVTADSEAFYREVTYLYMASGLRSYAEVIANQANTSAAVAGVPLTAGLIRRAADMGAYMDASVLVTPRSKGVRLTLSEYPDRSARCDVVVDKVRDYRLAVVRCKGVPSNMPAPLPASGSPRR